MYEERPILLTSHQSLARDLKCAGGLSFTSQRTLRGFSRARLWQYAGSQERNRSEDRSSTNIGGERHFHVPNAREKDVSTDDVVREEQFGRRSEDSRKDDRVIDRGAEIIRFFCEPTQPRWYFSSRSDHVPATIERLGRSNKCPTLRPASFECPVRNSSAVTK